MPIDCEFNYELNEVWQFILSLLITIGLAQHTWFEVENYGLGFGP